MKRLLGGVVLLASIAGAVLLVRVHLFVTSSNAPVPPAAPDLVAALSDRRPVNITFTTPDWKKVHEVVTVDALQTDRRLWRKMHFGDWDKVPASIREPALGAMVHAYAGLFRHPNVWRAMSPGAWDRIPQPVRAMAYLRMIWHWSRQEQVGVEFGLDPEILAQTIGAIVMAESWFEHRAVNENPWGNRDLGLAQCSDYCRETLAQMADSGEVAFSLTEADYFDPWIAARVATVWFERELIRAEGDVPLAIRAYHRGLDNAMDERGDAYLARVQRLRRRYIRTQSASESWQFLVRRIAPLRASRDGAAALPALGTHRQLIHDTGDAFGLTRNPLRLLLFRR